MKKETLISILIGFFIGTGIILTLYHTKKNSSQTNIEQDLEKDTDSDSKDTKQIQNNLISIIAPKQEQIQLTNDIKLIGMTIANSNIVVYINDSSPIFSKSDDSGNFTIPLHFENGPSIVDIFVIDEDGKVYNKKTYVIVGEKYLKDEEQSNTTKDQNQTVNDNDIEINKQN